MTGRRWPSAAVAALFAVHPLHVESVAWVAERKDVLSTLFFLLALLAYYRYTERPGLGRWSLVFLCMAVGLLCKPMLVTLPFVLLLLDYWPLGRFVVPSTVSRLLLEKLPLLALAVATSIVTMHAQASMGATKMIGDKVHLPLQLANAAVAYAKYLAKTSWPVNLAVLYPYDFHPRPAVVAASVALLVVLTAAAIAAFRRAPYLAVGWFWYLGTLVPTIGIVQVGAQGLADRYNYIPSIGIYLAVVWLVADWRRAAGFQVGEQMEYRQSAFLSRFAVAAGFCAALTVLLVVTYRQVSYWSDSVRLFRHALAVTGDTPESCENLGDGLLHRERYAEAAEQFRKVLEMDAKTFRQTPAELAQALAGQGRINEAIALVRDTLPDTMERARAMNDLGNFLVLRFHLDEGIPLLQEAIKLAPEQAKVYRNLAYVFATCPNPRYRNGAKAVELARRACELTDWTDPACRVTLADAYLETHDRERAIEELRAALSLNPKDKAIAKKLDKTVKGLP